MDFCFYRQNGAYANKARETVFIFLKHLYSKDIFPSENPTAFYNSKSQYQPSFFHILLPQTADAILKTEGMPDYVGKGRHMEPKLSFIDQSDIAKKAVFYVGGHYTGKKEKTHLCNQMYVEAYFPHTLLYPHPIIMFHGAGQTNVNWMITPDGRMGWADYFVSKGFAVYLAEQPARGRSAYHPEENGPRIYHSAESLIRRFTSDQGDWPQSRKHTQWPGESTSLEEETLKQFLASQVEYLPSNKDSQALVLAAGQELLNITGPAILLTHSQAGPFGWLLADACPQLVRGIVAMEPSGPPFSAHLTSSIAENYGLTELPLHYDPPVEKLEDLKLTLLKAPEQDLSDGWIFQEPAPQLPRLQGIPILLLVSEASYHAQYDHLTSRVLRQCGVQHDFVRLEEQGIYGNGHMMMLEKNNLEIADLIIDWLKKS